MTRPVLVDDRFIELVCADYLIAVSMREKAELMIQEYGEALREVAGPHTTYDCGPFRVLVTDTGEVVVRRLGDQCH